MTLKGVIAFVLLFSLNSIALLADYVTVVEHRPIISETNGIPVPFFDCRPKLTHPAARSLCDSWASCLSIAPVNHRRRRQSFFPSFQNKISKVQVKKSPQHAHCADAKRLEFCHWVFPLRTITITEQLCKTPRSWSTVCLKKHPGCFFSYNSRKHCRIFIIFGTNIIEKVSNQKMLYFSTSFN